MSRPEKSLLGFFLTIAIALAGFAAPLAEAKVLPGIEQLLKEPYIEELRGKRVGVLAHHVSRTLDGTHLVDLLHAHEELSLTVIFAPEHGFRGTEDKLLPDTKDEVTGLPVFSLYGPRRAPTPEQLALLDVVVVDLQDVGVRYYTYAATMALTMKAARDAGKKVVVLDRPNPIGGEIVEGAVLEEDMQGHIAAFYPVSTRHGMTLGELARLFNTSFGIGVELTVVPLAGWKRSMLWDETGLEWAAPSPALPTFHQTWLYGIFGALEAMPLAVGRSQTNERAFEIYGAPWINARAASRLVAELNRLDLPGLRFHQTQWVPDRREYSGKLCRGFRIEVTERKAVQGLRSFIDVAKTMRRVLGPGLYMKSADAMIGAHWLRAGMEEQVSTRSLLQRTEKESQVFLKQRNAALLYE